MRPKKPFSAGNPTFAIFITLLLALAIAPAQAQTFKVLHTFRGPNGALPITQLVRDAAGNFYGTTGAGGNGKGVCVSFFNGCGTAFKLNKYGKQVWLHSFNEVNGIQPMAGLLRDKEGNLYGTTVLGGDTKCFQYGCGTVFKLDPTGKETVLHKFSGSRDGEMPEALLVEDSAGNLYGTTYLGGSVHNAGTVFKVDDKGTETVLHRFCSQTNCADGRFPYSGVIINKAGKLFGVTTSGGSIGAGEVFELDTTGKETVLYSFNGGSDGSGPSSVLVADAAGNLYGTTQEGGNDQCGGSGCGVVFEVSPHSDGSWTESVLYVFCSLSNCADGERPYAGPLIIDSAGNLYGTTFFGGDPACGRTGCGVVFKLYKSGNETVLHSFTGSADGAYPWAGLIMDKAGNLYGAAGQGGDLSCPIQNGCGVVFKITP
jgi:uncharacterized repeat protein (TIGR03803 family)